MTKPIRPVVVGSANGNRFKNGGDTQGLVGLPNGGFHVAWINGASGKMQLWFTSVSVEPADRNLLERVQE